MKSLTNVVIGSLALIGIGTAGYRAYKIKKMNDALKEENVIEIEVESKEASRK